MPTLAWGIMAPTLLHSIRGLIARGDDLVARGLGSAGGPLAEADANLLARSVLAKRDDEDPSRGVLDPHDISNVGFFVLFALIGVAFVITGIWFFFWAKNGGFHFKDGDWDDYKSTVLRRKGPNGTILSGATESTDLGGGSVYRDVADDDGRTVVTESTALSGITAGASDIVAREKRKKKQEQRDRDREDRRKTRGEKHRSSRHVGNDGVEDHEAEEKAKKELRSYRHERPARVGGLNKESEGSQWDGSTNPTESTASSDLLSNRQSTPTSTPTKEKRGIRKVYSTADRNEQERSRAERAEARRNRDGNRDENRISRRDFSYQRSAIGTESTVTESLLESDGDLGTKSYHHPMPELRAQRQREREERRARRGGYRRGRGEDEDEL